MNRRFLLAGAFAATLTCSAAQGQTQTPTQTQIAPQAIELPGVKYPASMNVANSNLVLNGAGIRYKFVVKVYTAGLYMGTKASTPEAVLATSGPKRVHVVMLRDIDANELGKLFTRGMQDNAPREEFSKSIPGTLRMADIFSAKKKLVAGEGFSIDFVPGVGTSVLVNGKAQGEPVKEPEFFNALLKIWLGQKPADEQLKNALLGKPAETYRSRGQQGRAVTEAVDDGIGFSR